MTFENILIGLVSGFIGSFFGASLGYFFAKKQIKFNKFYEKKFEIMVELYSLIADFTNKILILSYSHSKDIEENIETDFHDLRMFLKLNAIFLIKFKDDLKNYEKMCFEQIENLKGKDYLVNNTEDKKKLVENLRENRDNIPKILNKLKVSILNEMKNIN